MKLVISKLDFKELVWGKLASSTSEEHGGRNREEKEIRIMLLKAKTGLVTN